MSILRAYALPHPPLAVPGVGRGQEKGIPGTLSSFEEVSAEIAELAPETVVYVTPHSVLFSDYFHISPGASAWGDFSRFNDSGTRLEAEYDKALAAEIIRLAERESIPAGGLGERDAKLDHGVLVPMWFINRRYSDYKTVRISQSGMEPADHYRLGRLIAEAAENTGRKTVIVASSDLSHKLTRDGPYGFAPEGPEFDAITTKALSEGDFFALFNIPEDTRERAAQCGYNSLMMLAGCFDRRKVESRLLSYEGPFGVGYAIAAFAPGDFDESRNFLEQFEQRALCEAMERKNSEDDYRELARRSLEYAVENGGELPFPGGLPEEMSSAKAGVFVSLHKNGRLRGCIGTIAPTTGCIAREIIQNAVSAGLHDSRFEPVTDSELPYLTYKVDVLSTPEPISAPEELDVKRYGVIVSSGHKRGLLLPNLDGIDTVEEQISIARKKAGISQNTPVNLERFEVVRHE
ncbi:MAG: AmmeMemoRadiSam system protein A [Oscillospiraceae bacterium]|nr:AmmeMemoRadiSam system protein A [Oscillospiraceae bacterium]